MQTTLNPELQRFVVATLARQYPAHVGAAPAPMLVALPAGIHPYNRNGGYFDAASNTIVAYQDIGSAILRDGTGYAGLEPFVQHELAHWFQFKVLGEKAKGSTNVHRLASWSEACFVATGNLWPELAMTRDQFSPTISVRTEEGVRKVPRDGALTDVQLHHWPRSLFEE